MARKAEVSFECCFHQAAQEHCSPWPGLPAVLSQPVTHQPAPDSLGREGAGAATALSLCSGCQHSETSFGRDSTGRSCWCPGSEEDLYQGMTQGQAHQPLQPIQAGMSIPVIQAGISIQSEIHPFLILSETLKEELAVWISPDESSQIITNSSSVV